MGEWSGKLSSLSSGTVNVSIDQTHQQMVEDRNNEQQCLQQSGSMAKCDSDSLKEPLIRIYQVNERFVIHSLSIGTGFLQCAPVTMARVSLYKPTTSPEQR